MKIAEEKRSVNINILRSKMALAGLNQKTLGQKLDPPVSRFSIIKYINEAKPYFRLRQVAKVLGSNVQTLFPKVNNQDAGSKDAV